MSETPYELFCKIDAAVPETTKGELKPTLGNKFMGYASGNFKEFERQKQKGSTATDYNAVDDSDKIQLSDDGDGTTAGSVSKTKLHKSHGCILGEVISC